MNQLPFLDAKHDYLWGEYELQGVADAEVPVLRTDETNTVRHVRDQLIALVRAGYDDGVIPILRGERLVGVVGAHELEHALSIVADEPDKQVRFGTLEKTHVFGEMSVGSLVEDVTKPDQYDFGVYMDQVRPIPRSPCQQRSS
jgi:chloride channel 3/4/5